MVSLPVRPAVRYQRPYPVGVYVCCLCGTAHHTATFYTVAACNDGETVIRQVCGPCFDGKPRPKVVPTDHFESLTLH